MSPSPPIAPEVDGTDSLLLAALQAGDESAFETLVRTYGGRMLAVARRVLGNDDDARDALQEAFLSAFKSIESFDGRAKLGTWLHRIVVNAALMKVRTKQRHPEQSIEDLLPTYKSDGHQESPADRWKAGTVHESETERRETRQQVRQKIDQLPESYRIVLVLRDIEEHDTETVAKMLDVSVSVVKVRLHRARQALRTLLDPVFGERPLC